MVVFITIITLSSPWIIQTTK